MDGEATVRIGWSSRAGLRPAAGADRSAPGGSGVTNRACSSTACERRGRARCLPRAAGIVPSRSPSSTTHAWCRRGSRSSGRWRGLAARAARRLRTSEALRSTDAEAARGRAHGGGAVPGAPRRGSVARASSRAIRAGSMPLPPYITEPLGEIERYQTVYAREHGSAAAPTAGLHFTPELLAQLDVERVTLHVGLDTFRPLHSEVVEEHTIHGERYSVAACCVGTHRGGGTRARDRHDHAGRARDARVGADRSRPAHGALHHARLHIPPRRPPSVTNFHLPRSTLLALATGVRRQRRDPGACTPSRSRSATASTPSAMRC